MTVRNVVPSTDNAQDLGKADARWQDIFFAGNITDGTNAASAAEIVAGLSDSRTPTAHKTTHATGGTDALTAADVGADASGAANTVQSNLDSHTESESSAHAASAVSVVATPENYSAETADVESHLIGIDTALASVGGGGTHQLISGGYVTRSSANLLFSPDASNIFFTYESSAWAAKTIQDVGVTVACTGLTASTLYYLYAYDNSGTIALDLSTTEPTTQNGIYVKTGATDRTLIARCQTDGDGAIVTYAESASKQLVCNLYNKRKIVLTVTDATNSWAYTTATWRSANNSAANRVEFVTDGRVGVSAIVSGIVQNSGGGIWVAVGVGVDSVSANSAQCFGSGAATTGLNTFALYGGTPAAGYHYLQWLEYSQAAGTTTWYGDSGGTIIQSGMRAEIMA